MARFCRRPSTTQQRLFVGLYPARFASSAGIAIVTGMYFAYGVPSNFFQVSSHSSTWVSASMIGIVTSPILYINVNKIVQTSRVDSRAARHIPAACDRAFEHWNAEG